MPGFAVDSGFSTNDNFKLVRFGDRAKLLEVELNEAQEIQNHKRLQLGSALLTNGFLTKQTMVLSDGDLTVPSCTIICNGDVFTIEDSMVIEVSNGESVYLSVFDTEVTYQSVLKKSGNLSGGITIDNDILDSRTVEESSRRIQIQVELTKTNTDISKTYLPVALIGTSTFEDTRVLTKINNDLGRTILGDNTFLTEVDGDTWLTSNAYHDGDHWQRVDITKSSWALSLLGSSNFPFETEQGASLLVAKPGANPILSDYGVVGGWEMGWALMSTRNMAIGGNGIELDGNGVSPYGRFVHYSDKEADVPVFDAIFTGIVTNLFSDFSGRDISTEDSWFVGRVDDSFQIRRLPASSAITNNNFAKLVEVDDLGTFSLLTGLTHTINSVGLGNIVDFKASNVTKVSISHAGDIIANNLTGVCITGNTLTLRNKVIECNTYNSELEVWILGS